MGTSTLRPLLTTGMRSTEEWFWGLRLHARLDLGICRIGTVVNAWKSS